MPFGAAPESRAMWKNADQPEDPFAPGKTRILSLKLCPRSSWRRSMIVPVAGSIPPQPEIVSFVTRAAPAATPPTTFRQCKTIILVQASRPGTRQGRVNAVPSRTEPNLHAGDGGQVVSRLRRIGCDDFRASRHDARDRRAGVAQNVTTGIFHDLRIAAAIGELPNRAWRVDPELGTRVQSLSFKEPSSLPDLFDRVVWAAEH